jgi:hypothetical protein
MPPPRTGATAHRHRIIRRVVAVRGQMRFVIDVAPRFDYARTRHEVALAPHGARFRSPALRSCGLAVEGSDLSVIVYSAPAGSPDAEALALLATIGLQTFLPPVSCRRPPMSSGRLGGLGWYDTNCMPHVHLSRRLRRWPGSEPQ